jgi:hypothetical protein
MKNVPRNSTYLYFLILQKLRSSQNYATCIMYHVELKPKLRDFMSLFPMIRKDNLV